VISPGAFFNRRLRRGGLEFEVMGSGLSIAIDLGLGLGYLLIQPFYLGGAPVFGRLVYAGDDSRQRMGLAADFARQQRVQLVEFGELRRVCRFVHP